VEGEKGISIGSQKNERVKAAKFIPAWEKRGEGFFEFPIVSLSEKRERESCTILFTDYRGKECSSKSLNQLGRGKKREKEKEKERENSERKSENVKKKGGKKLLITSLYN